MNSFQGETLILSQQVVTRVVGGETLIVPVRAKVGDLASIYRFNATGTLIWQLLEAPKSITDLSIAVGQAFEVDPVKVESDVKTFVEEMKSAGLVQVAASLAMAGD